MSFCTATGRTRSSTKVRTVSWISRCSSLSSKSISRGAYRDGMRRAGGAASPKTRMGLHPLSVQEASDTSTMRRSAANPYVLVCVLVCVGLVAAWSAPRTVAYDLASVGAVVAVVVGIRRNRPARLAGWYLLAAGTAAWVSGNVVASVAELNGDSPRFG